MSVLWDSSRIAPRTDIVVAGETLPQLFRNAARQRGARIFMRQKQFGLWRAWRWADTETAVREIATPVMWLSESATLSSGNLPSSTALMESCTVPALRLSSTARPRLARTPETMTVSMFSASLPGGDCASTAPGTHSARAIPWERSDFV